MNRELPVLFNTEMVRAVMRPDNPKTATRRAIKGFTPGDAVWGYTAFTPEGCISCRGTFADGYGEKFYKLPCRTGDILYVRETWSTSCSGCECCECPASCSAPRYRYRADCPDTEDKWKPSIHMPKEAARIWLKVTEVRVERLQDITHVDIIKEGIEPECLNARSGEKTRDDFRRLWDSTVDKTKTGLYGWDANPWVWAIEFERCQDPGGWKLPDHD